MITDIAYTSADERMNFWDVRQILIELEQKGIAPATEQIEYLFFRLASVLKQRNQKVIYGEPQWDDPEKGFSITMYRVGSDGYEFAELCCLALGREPKLECGVTMSVNFDSAEEKNEYYDRFQAALVKAEKEVQMT